MAAQALTIFLLKDDYDATTCLEDGHKLCNATAKNLPPGAELFLYSGSPTQPNWCRYLGVPSKYSRSSLSGILFVPAGGRIFAFTFGHAYHQLNEDSYEHDFGLLVTLNGVDPQKLRVADSAQPGAGRIKRTQGNHDSDFTLLDFRFQEEVLRSLSGKMRDEFATWFDSATGAANLKIRAKVPATKLDALCRQLLKLYNCESYKDTFPGAQTLSRVRDPSIIQRLDAKLLGAIRAKNSDLFLVIPEIVEAGGGMTVYFSGAGRSVGYSDVFLEPYLAYLAANGVSLSSITIDTLKKQHKIHVFDGDQHLVGKFSVYRSLTFDTALDASGETYHLLDRTWYKAVKNFVADLQTELDRHWIACSYPPFSHADEGNYNIAFADASPHRVCLDKTNIAPPKSSMIEPCDVLEVSGSTATFVHVKLSTYSGKLSHLFSQGMTATELLRQDLSAISRLKRLVNGKANVNELHKMLKAIDGRKFRVVYAIVTHKSELNKSRNLPLFSRITLRRSIHALKAMDAEALFCFVENTVKKLEKKKTSTGKGVAKAA